MVVVLSKFETKTRLGFPAKTVDPALLRCYVELVQWEVMLCLHQNKNMQVASVWALSHTEQEIAGTNAMLRVSLRIIF